MGKRAYINDGNDNWIPLVSSLPNMDAYATVEYVNGSLENIDALPDQSGNDGKFLTTNGSSASWATVNLDMSPYLTIDSASTSYLTQDSASTIYLTKTSASELYSSSTFEISDINVTKNPITSNRFSPYVNSEITIFGTFPSASAAPTVTLSYSDGTFSVPSENISSYDTAKIILTTGVRVFPAKEFTSVSVTFGADSTSLSVKLISSAAPYYLDWNQIVTVPAMSTVGSSGSISYTVLSGSLPPNFTLNSDGTIYGWYKETYTNAESIRYTAVIRATDSVGKTWEETVEFNFDIPFFYRQVITTAYVAGGYINSTPWRNVSKTSHTTDVTTSLGDLLQTTHAYTSGACSRNLGFIWGGGGAAGVTDKYTSTSVFNMRNDTTYSKTSAMDTAVSIGDSATVQNSSATKAWIAGNNSTAVIQKFNMVTEQASGTTSLSYLLDPGEGTGAVFNETDGYFYCSNSNMKINFATETQSAGKYIGSHGQQKGIPSKLDRGYGGNEGNYNGGYTLRRWNLVTESQDSLPSKPIGNIGEENYSMGQWSQYMLGMYNGAQTSRAWKFNYMTDTGYEGSASMQPSAVSGRSSGHCMWRD